MEPFAELFRPAVATKQFFRAMKPLSALTQNSGNRGWLSSCQQTGGSADRQTGDRHMQSLSFVLALAFVLAGPTLAGSSDVNLPGIGTFAYSGSPIVTSAPQPIVVAAR